MTEPPTDPAAASDRPTTYVGRLLDALDGAAAAGGLRLPRRGAGGRHGHPPGTGSGLAMVDGGQTAESLSSDPPAGKRQQHTGSARPGVEVAVDGARRAEGSVPASGRMVQLDLLRGVAILLVLFDHSPMNPREAGWLSAVAATLKRFGWTGVDLFFVLSGFLIGGLLFGEIRRYGQLKVGRFLVRRGFKIWPSYYAFLAFVALQLYRHRRPGEGLVDVLRPLVPSLLNVQNYLGTPRPHLWSLGVEEHFYVVLPFLLLLALRVRRAPGPRGTIPGVVPVAVALMIGCAALRCLVNLHRPFELLTHLTPTHLRIDSLAYGVVLAYLGQLEPSPLAFAARRRGWLALAGVLFVSPMLYLDLKRDAGPSTWGFTALYLGYGCLLLAAVTTPARGWMTSLPVRVIAFIGINSYPIYLWHGDTAVAPAAALFQGRLGRGLPGELRWLLAMSTSIALATTAGVLASLLIERPALAVRDKLFPSRSKAVVRPGE